MFFSPQTTFFLSGINCGHTVQFKYHLSTAITHKTAVLSRCCFEYIRTWFLYWGGLKLGFLLTSSPPKPCLHIKAAEWDGTYMYKLSLSLSSYHEEICRLQLPLFTYKNFMSMFALTVYVRACCTWPEFFQNLTNFEMSTFLRIIRNRQLLKNVL